MPCCLACAGCNSWGLIMRKSLFGLLSLLIFVSYACTASAALVDVIYTGTVSGDYNKTRFGSIFDGTSYTATFIFETGIAGTTVRNVNEYIDAGGTLFDDRSPNLLSSISINMKTATFVGSSLAEIYGVHNTYISETGHDAENLITGQYLSQSIGDYLYDGPFPARTDVSYSYQKQSYDHSSGAYLDSFGLINLNPESIFVSAVPLPASASMFGAALVVLGVAGYSFRRRKAADVT